MKSLTPVNQEALISAFVEAYRSTAASFYETGKRLCDVLDNVPGALDRIRESIPGITNETLQAFIQVGRGAIYEKLFLSEGPGVERLRKCDIATQKRHYEEPIAVLIKEGEKTSHLMVPIFDMTLEQARQAFDGSVIRTLAQQRQWLESRTPKPKTVAIEKSYTIRGDKLILHANCIFTRQQLAHMLAEMP